MNTAMTLMLSWMGGAVRIIYKAPHANRGTPARLRYPRNRRFRLFIGHRP